MNHNARQRDMTGRGTARNPAASTRTVLASIVARFADAWEKSGSSPDLAAYLPDSAELRRVSLIELIKVDLEYRRLRNDSPMRLADYCAAFPELGTLPLPPDLIYEELHSRRRSGLAVDLNEYALQFPDQVQLLEPRLKSGGYESTMIARPSADDPLDAINVGQQVDDFDLMMGLGSGAFARVFLARQRSMERLVALKISHNHGREPQTLAQLDHEYIVRLFDQRLIEDEDLKLMYMEYLPGGTLLNVLERVVETPPDQRNGRLLLDAVDEVLRDKGYVRPSGSGARADIAALSWPETIAWLGRRLADALEYSARRGVLHRDIKPANVLLTAEGIPKLADFNISFSNHIAGASPIAYFGGSLAYMSPEQLEACHPQMTGTPADLDGRSDIYALGVMLWELLTGHRPFNDETTAGESETSLERMLTLRRRGIEAAVVSVLPSDCPATLRRALLTCLAPRPEDRWSSSAELAQQLQLCLDARARDLVDPPPSSWRAKLSLRPVPIATLAVVGGNALAALYIWYHNYALMSASFSIDAKRIFDNAVVIVAASVVPLVGGLMLYVCRFVIFVPWGMRKGKRYDPVTLERVRSDTLSCGDRLAIVGFAAWVVVLIVLGGLTIAIADLPKGLLANIFATHLVCGAIAATYPYFLTTFHVVRWYYPALLTHGTTTAADARKLRSLARRCTLYLAAVASVPPVGVIVGVAFLDSDQMRMVIDSIVGLCIGGILAFIGAYWLFRKLEIDLGALLRVVAESTRAEQATSIG